MRPFLATAILLAATLTASAADRHLTEPLLRLQAEGPTAIVNAVAFSPDGETLYAGGYDKVVRAWTLDRKTGRFTPRREQTYRVPIGPASAGFINALAVSGDGKWLAVGGLAARRGLPGQAEPGVVLPRAGWVDDTMLQDEGEIYLFDTTKPETVQVLRGHRGPVVALSFASGSGSLLTSVAREGQGKDAKGVARIWQAGKDTPLPGSFSFELPENSWPGLAAWTTGAKDASPVLAVALRKQPLLVWHPGLREPKRVERDGDENNSIIAVPDAPGRQTVLAGTFKPDSASLERWQVEAADGLSVREGPATEIDRSCAVRALTLCGSDIAAVVLQFPKEMETYRLRLVGLGGKETPAGGVKLWEGLGVVKSFVAGTPRGRFVAVAGHPDNGVRVFAVKDLLDGKAEPLQVLRSEGLPRRHIAIVKKDKAVGLVFSDNLRRVQPPGDEPAKPADGDLVIDFQNGRLTNQVDGWNLDSPAAGKWKVDVEIKDDMPPVFHVRDGGREVGKFTLGPGRRITQYALLPSSPVKIPLMAIAFEEAGEPILALFDVSTGRELRRLTGHADRVGGLAFSSDGKLLASASEDQTLCLWSLADLDRVYVKQGIIRGLAVREYPGPVLKVGAIDRESLSAKNREALEGIEADATVEEATVKGKREMLKTAAAFYLLLWKQKPGDEITLRVGTKNVTLTIDQGVDERRPMLSLFVTRGHEWIGWRPQGDYGLSAREAETLIGWHKNTNRPGRPVEFHTAEAHRKEFYRPRLLEDVYAEIVPRGQTEKPADPRLNVWVEGTEKDPAQPGVEVVRGAVPPVYAAVEGFDPKKLAWIRWQMDGGDWQEFAEGDAAYKAKLPPFPWKRGEHNVQIALKTFEDTPREFRKTVRLFYVPPSPELAWGEKAKAAAQLKLLRQGELSVDGLARSAAPGIETELELYHFNDRIASTRAGARSAVDRKVKLRIGDNPFRLVARNQGARKDDRREAAELAINLVYKPVPPPVIVVGSVGDRSPVDGRVVVSQKTVRIRGTITADEELTSAAVGKQSVLGKEPKQELNFDVEHTAEKPGKHTVVIAARARYSEEATATLEIDYRPPLPRFVLVKPGELSSLPPGTEKVRMEGRLEPPADEHTTVEVRHRGKRIEHRLSEDGKTLSAELILEPGTAGDVEVTSRIGERKETTRLTAYAPMKPQDPVLRVWIESPEKDPTIALDPDVTLVRRTVPVVRAAVDNFDAGKVDALRWKLDDGKPQDFVKVGDGFKANLPPFPWTRGAHTVQVSLTTKEDKPREFDRSLKLFYVPSAPQLALGPTAKGWQGKTVRQGELTLDALAQAATPGVEVELVLLQEGKEVERAKAGTEAKLDRKVRLRPGSNSFRLVARNRDALKESEAQETTELPLTVNYKPVPPPEIVVESVGGMRPVEGKATVTQKSVRLRGTITADEELVSATLGKQKLIEEGQARKEIRFDVQHTLDSPGTHTVAIAARARYGEEATVKLEIDYRPPLPRFVLERPSASDLGKLPAGTEKVALKGKLDPPADEHCTMEVRVRNRLVKSEVSRDGSSLTADVPLEPGANEITVKSRIGERDELVSLSAYVQRPPRILNVDHPRMSDAPVVEVKARVETPEGLALRDAFLENDQGKPRRELKREAASAARDGGAWVMTVKDVDVTAGVANRFVLHVLNADGETRTDFTIMGPKPPVKKPEVTLLAPKDDVRVDRPDFRVRFIVQSEAPLKRVAVLLRGQEVDALKKPQGADSEWTADLALKLGNGNVVEVLAENEGGSASSGSRVITYVPPFIPVHFTELTWKGGKATPKVNGEAVEFASADMGEVVIRGRLEGIPGEAPIPPSVSIRAWVNGGEQAGVDLGDRVDQHSREFAIPLRLNRDVDNQVELEFGKLPVKPTRFRVLRCAAPIRDQRLQVLVLGVDRDQEKLAKRALDLFRAEKVRSGQSSNVPASLVRQFEAPGFQSCRLQVLPPDADREQVRDAILLDVKPTLDSNRSGEVVVIYYQGKAELTRKGTLALHTLESSKTGEMSAAVTLEYIHGFLTDTQAAQLLLLDVDHTRGEKPPMPEFKRTGVFHYAWMNPDRDDRDKVRLIDLLDRSLARAKSLGEASEVIKQEKPKDPATWFQPYLEGGLARVRWW